MKRYTQKKVVIAGGTIGMGLATASALVEGGAEVLVIGRNERNLEAARSTLGPRARVVRSDMTRLADIDALRDRVKQELGALDFLFINAGVSELEPFESVSEASYDRMFDVNAKGAFFTAQRLAPLLRRGGAIVFTTVTNGPANPNLSLYAGTKAAVRAFAGVTGWAAETASRSNRPNMLFARPILRDAALACCHTSRP